MKALESVLGVKPRGYRAPAWELTPITLDLVRKHGMVHSSNLMDDVFPYLHPGEPPVVELPVQWVLDDAPYFLMHPRLAPRPMQSPEVIFGIWRDEFRGFYEWGGLFNLACHPQVIGHPSRLLMLRRLIRLMKRHRGVWWATASEVADHRSEEHTSELQSQSNLVCRLLLEKKKTNHNGATTEPQTATLKPIPHRML